VSRLIPFMLICLCTGADADTLRFVGTAHALDSEAWLYSEAYTDTLDGNRQLAQSDVIYTLPNGSTLAKKQLHYSQHRYAPAFHFSNLRTGYGERLEWLDDGKIKLSLQEPDERIRHAVMKVPEPAVADAGFNAFVRDHLTQLAAGKTVPFNFINPARLTWYRFNATMTASSPDTITIMVAPANSFLRWLVPPIELVYGRPHQRLMHYRGLTNISFSGNETLKARIDYEYEESAAAALLPQHEPLEYLPNHSEG